MIGDKLNIKNEHHRAVNHLIQILFPEIISSDSKYIVTIAGESGAGKSEIAFLLGEKIGEKEKLYNSLIIQQDDYFVYPPATNAEMRKKDINHVGISEVRLDLLEENLQEILNGKDEIEKPLVIYQENRIAEEKISCGDIFLVIVEGTYTTLLRNVHKRIFIDLTFRETKKSRLLRAREEQDEYLETILEIEHEIISSHRSKADIIINKDYRIDAIK